MVGGADNDRVPERFLVEDVATRVGIYSFPAPIGLRRCSKEKRFGISEALGIPPDLYQPT